MPLRWEKGEGRALDGKRGEGGRSPHAPILVDHHLEIVFGRAVADVDLGESRRLELIPRHPKRAVVLKREAGGGRREVRGER